MLAIVALVLGSTLVVASTGGPVAAAPGAPGREAPLPGLDVELAPAEVATFAPVRASVTTTHAVPVRVSMRAVAVDGRPWQRSVVVRPGSRWQGFRHGGLRAGTYRLVARTLPTGRYVSQTVTREIRVVPARVRLRIRPNADGQVQGTTTGVAVEVLPRAAAEVGTVSISIGRRLVTQSRADGWNVTTQVPADARVGVRRLAARWRPARGVRDLPTVRTGRPFTVSPAASTPTVALEAPATAVQGEPVRLRATVSGDNGAVDGRIAFVAGDRVLASAQVVDGATQAIRVRLDRGTYDLVARFEPTSTLYSEAESEPAVVVVR